MSLPVIYRYWGTQTVRSYRSSDELVLPHPWKTSPRWPRWFSEARPGNVVLTGRGTERVIRATTRYAAEPRRGGSCGRLWLTFSILHCSWTEACYTCYGAADLMTLGYTHTGHSIPMLGEMDLRIRTELMRRDDGGAKWKARQMDCCDVEGVR